MTPSRLCIALAALLALAALAPTASAAQGDLLARSASYDSAATQDGQLSMLFLYDVSGQLGSASGTGARPWVDLQAASIDAYVFEKHNTAVGSGDTGQSTPWQASPTQTTHFSDARAVLSSFQPGFQLHLYTLDGTLPFTARSEGGVIDTTSPARMNRAAFGTGTPDGVPAGGAPGPSDFALVERTGSWLVQHDSAPRTSLVVQGDLVLEIRGITLQAQDQAQKHTLESGLWREPVQPGVPSDNAFNQRSVFVRLFLSKATVEVANEGGSPTIAWAASALTSSHAGEVTLHQTSGHVNGADGKPISLDGARYVVPAGSVLTLAPQESAMSVGVGSSGLGPRGSIASVPAPASAALLGTGAILALAAAVAVGVVRKVARLPLLAEVETAIEEGRYGRAARLAGRILTRRPEDESARLARGIALTKAGHKDQAVRELAHHLQHTPATDGSLHYVLGLAQLDLGRAEEGRAALREAVRLTPSLQAEVAPRLGKAFSPQSTTTREPHGYA